MINHLILLAILIVSVQLALSFPLDSFPFYKDPEWSNEDVLYLEPTSGSNSSLTATYFAGMKRSGVPSSVRPSWIPSPGPFLPFRRYGTLRLGPDRLRTDSEDQSTIFGTRTPTGFEPENEHQRSRRILFRIMQIHGFLNPLMAKSNGLPDPEANEYLG
ncbi:uncharacterized protein LOC129601048 [Paramacrobiotus metropolitanus]|uniref:uncharacterized protein LOC129601048 n=1 Tax=Paramacrobiotus metropolitanus TaxID=2943436 RepID=UPI002445D90F|nr:uncharacterized protein LOC129601048 [Paramacrobiotus metropolitanus]